MVNRPYIVEDYAFVNFDNIEKTRKLIDRNWCHVVNFVFTPTQ